jgi:hypothetical protein
MMRGIALVLVTSAACWGGGARATTVGERSEPVSQLPIAEDAKRLDGREVRLVGIYRKELVAKKKGRPADQLFGHVVIELEGHPRAYHPQAWDGARAMISLGTEPRPEDEIARFTDQRVRATGRLVLRPARDDDDGEVASTLPAPALLDVVDVQAAD